MELEDYLNSTFPGLILKPNLCKQWDISLHFEFAQGMYQLKDDDTLNLDMFNCVYNQALTIFNTLFSEQDEIFLVTNVYHSKYIKDRMKPIKVYQRSIRNKNLKYNIRQTTLPFVFDDEDVDEYYTSQFSLKCNKCDIRYPLLIKAACNEDFPLKPKFGEINGSYYPDVFFINASKNIIFFIYDDRGCNVIANNKETIRPLYNQYKDWLGQYDNEKIKQLLH